MTAYSSALLLVTSQAARLAGPSAALLLLAAMWPAEAFGRFAGAYALASLLGLLPATGLSAWLLDRSAREAGAARGMLWRAWAMMAGLGALAMMVAVGLSAVMPGYGGAALPALTLAMLLAGAADNGFAALRGQRNEGPVAAIAVPTNLALLAAAFVLHEQGAETVAVAWVLVRSSQVAMLAWSTARFLPPSTGPAPSYRTIGPFFGSQSAGVFYGQADTLLVHALAGEVAAALYTIAARLLQLASFAAQTLAQWFQPRLAAEVMDSPDWLAQRRRLWLCLGVISAGGLAAFCLVLPLVQPSVLGPSYQAAAPVIQLAGLVLAARCFVAGQWIELTARQLETCRARASWLLLGIFIALAWPLTVQFGAFGAMAAHLLALGPIAALSGRSLARARQR